VRLTLSVEMQRFFGCVIGEHVSSEIPWTTIKKEQIEANLTVENEKSEIFALKESLMVSYVYKNSVFILQKPMKVVCL